MGQAIHGAWDCEGQCTLGRKALRATIVKLFSKRGRRGICAAGVAALLVVLALELALSVRRESLSWDEGDHIFAGYMSWRRGDFGLNPEHPPLVKMVATIPLLPMTLNVPSLQDRNFKLEAYFDGRDLIFGNDAEKIIFRARMAAMSLTLLLALVVFLATREMFGTGAGFIALTLVVFEPNLLAHGALVTTDAGLACFLIATIYAFYRYVKAPSAWRLVVTGMAAGLAAATKHSAILLLPILVLLALTELFRRSERSERDGEVSPQSRGKQALRLGAAIGVVAGIAVVILWSAYGFRYGARPDGMEINPPLIEAVRGLTPMEARGISSFARWHLLPESYLYGLADVRDVANFMPSYIFGKVYAHGVWFYFPVAFVTKGTLGLMGLLLLAIVALAARGWRVGRQRRRITAEGRRGRKRGGSGWHMGAEARDILFDDSAAGLFGGFDGIAAEYRGAAYFAGIHFCGDAGGWSGLEFDASGPAVGVSYRSAGAVSRGFVGTRVSYFLYGVLE
jgi:hypothetical protein